MASGLGSQECNSSEASASGNERLVETRYCMPAASNELGLRTSECTHDAGQASIPHLGPNNTQGVNGPLQPVKHEAPLPS